MSRLSVGAVADTVEVKPANNVYTVMAAAACIVVVLGLVVLFLRAKELQVPLIN